MIRNLDQWLKAGAYLPAPLKDFHDQKDLFKTMHGSIDPNHAALKDVNWIAGQGYVIDIFLWFMARRGYTLQRVRAKGDFRDLGADIAAMKDGETRLLQSIMAQRSAPAPSATGPSVQTPAPGSTSL